MDQLVGAPERWVPLIDEMNLGLLNILQFFLLQFNS